MANISHYESLAIVMDDFDIWGGKTSLSASDFRLGDGGELPPSTIAHLGNKKIISSDHLRGFNRLKTACRRFLLRHGVPFMNGVAVPVKVIQDVAQKLDAIGAEFQSLKHDFLANYDNAIEDWVSAHPDYEDVIRRNALTATEVAKRLNFEYQVFMISASGDPDQAKKLSEKVSSLGQGLIDEVAETAEKMFDKHFAGKVRCGVRAQQQLQSLRDKVDGLSFLNGNLTPLVSMMDSALRLFQTASQGGFVQAPHFWEIASVVLILSKRRTIEQYANGEIQVDSVALNIQGQVAGTPPLGSMDGGKATDNTGTADIAQQPKSTPTSAASGSAPSDSGYISDIDAFFAAHHAEAVNNDAKPEQPVSEQLPPVTEARQAEVDSHDRPEDHHNAEFAYAAVPAISFEGEMAFF